MATAFGSGYAGENNFLSVWVSIALDLIPNVFLIPFDLVFAQQRTQFVLKSNLGFVAQELPSVFGGEDQMNVNGGQGLWHERKWRRECRLPIPKGLRPSA